MDESLRKELTEELSKDLSKEGWSIEEINNAIDNVINNVINYSNKNTPSQREREDIFKLSKNYGWNNEEIAIAFNISRVEVELVLEIMEMMIKK
jgi:uncharacterized protein Smg (DUF494 family)